MKRAFLYSAAVLAASTVSPVTALAADDDAIITSPARIISAGGLVYSPVYLGAGHSEFGLAGGMFQPRAGGAQRPFPLAGAGGALGDGLNWAVLLSAESQVGIRQRYAAGRGWSWGGSYIGRFNLAADGSQDYGASYKNSLLWRLGGLELTAQPEVGYLAQSGAQAGVALGADLWLNDRISVGANGQYRWKLPSQALDRRWGVGAKYLFNNHAYTWLNYVSSPDGQGDAGLVGFGYYN
ncbi:MAG: hypothetical protein VKP62_16385 [Candidatus Sericytochromatia bacterium]|nr:hypothetical protein [Candidatus Sericytochromatia bacterium]